MQRQAGAAARGCGWIGRSTELGLESRRQTLDCDEDRPPATQRWSSFVDEADQYSKQVNSRKARCSLYRQGPRSANLRPAGQKVGWVGFIFLVRPAPRSVPRTVHLAWRERLALGESSSPPQAKSKKGPRSYSRSKAEIRSCCSGVGPCGPSGSLALAAAARQRLPVDGGSCLPCRPSLLDGELPIQ